MGPDGKGWEGGSQDEDQRGNGISIPLSIIISRYSSAFLAYPVRGVSDSGRGLIGLWAEDQHQEYIRTPSMGQKAGFSNDYVLHEEGFTPRISRGFWEERYGHCTGLSTAPPIRVGWDWIGSWILGWASTRTCAAWFPSNEDHHRNTPSSHAC